MKTVNVSLSWLDERGFQASANFQVAAADDEADALRQALEVVQPRPAAAAAPGPAPAQEPDAAPL